LCGAIRYKVNGPLRDVIACHCGQCRRTSGHFVAATAARPENLVLSEDKGLRWYQSSKTARRGFCQDCGSSVFYAPESGDRISIAAGTLDDSSALKIAAHIYVEEAGSYYVIEDDAVRIEGGHHNVQMPTD
jgi:hypothetical protein